MKDRRKTHLTTFICPTFNAFPECLNFLVYKLFHPGIRHPWLPRGARLAIDKMIHVLKTHHSYVKDLEHLGLNGAKQSVEQD